MATKAVRGGFGAPHTAGIFSDMTVDGPVIGTLVAIMDRAKNLPNRRSMGKQDPYCAARLGKEAKKTNTDRRGGQTPRWDQELRFTVHDSPDYHQLKVSVFNDDKKTELIGETFVNLEGVITPGGGQSDTWHGLNCKGKYSGEIRIELTYYDTRPKEEKPTAERRREKARTDGQKVAVGGPRESAPVKRRPLPTDPTGASPSPVNTPEYRGLQGIQSGPRQPRQRASEPTITPQRREQADAPQRRPLPEASSLNGTPSSNTHTPQHQQYAQRPAEKDVYTPPNPRSSNSTLPQYGQEGFDMSYTAPKPYETQMSESPSHLRESTSRAMLQDNFRPAPVHHHNHPADLPHSQSAPIVPTSHTYEPELLQQQDLHHGHRSPKPNPYQDAYDPTYQVEPLRLSRNSRSNEQMVLHNSYQSQHSHMESASPYDQYASHGRRQSQMQPTVEDEDDLPPPPPVHRSGASTIPQPHQSPPDYRGDAPAPLSSGRYRADSYDMPLQPYGANDFFQERRYTHPRPDSRPVSRDAMAPSPLRNEAIALPAALVAGMDASRPSRDSLLYQTPPQYDSSSRQRQLSEPDYHTPPQYERHQQSAPPSNALQYYQHPPPEEPRRRSPVHDPAPIIKPRAVSPAVSPDERASRLPLRSMPTRKSVSPRPPPSNEPEPARRLSGVPFDPDSFDVFNPSVKPSNTSSDPERPGSSLEMNDKGQIVTFNGRVIDASDHLPLDSWAPEPERKANEKEKPTRTRPVLSGARDLEEAKQREERYRRDRAERDRIRTLANASFGTTAPGATSNALVTVRHDFGRDHASPVNVNAGTLVLADRDVTPPSSGRNRLQKRNQRPMSSHAYDSPPTQSHTQSASIPMPPSNVLRERENLGGYGSSPGYNRHSMAAAPPIPAKIPLNRGEEDLMALSLELQSIDIGPGSGGGRRGNGSGGARGTVRRYGF